MQINNKKKQFLIKLKNKKRTFLKKKILYNYFVFFKKQNKIKNLFSLFSIYWQPFLFFPRTFSSLIKKKQKILLKNKTKQKFNIITKTKILPFKLK